MSPCGVCGGEGVDVTRWCVWREGMDVTVWCVCGGEDVTVWWEGVDMTMWCGIYQCGIGHHTTHCNSHMTISRHTATVT